MQTMRMSRYIDRNDITDDLHVCTNQRDFTIIDNPKIALPSKVKFNLILADCYLYFIRFMVL